MVMHLRARKGLWQLIDGPPRAHAGQQSGWRLSDQAFTSFLRGFD